MNRPQLCPADAWLISEARSHQDQRQEAKVKSKGKRTSSSSAGRPGGRQEEEEEKNRKQAGRSASGPGGRWGSVIFGWRTARPPRVVFVLGFVSLIHSLTSRKNERHTRDAEIITALEREEQ